MTIRPFVSWPDKRLRTAAADVAGITDDIRAIWADMVDTMIAMPGHGVGLAAPQIGVMLRLAVVDAAPDRSRRVLLANPEILSSDPEVVKGTEASPNLPGVSAEVPRPKSVTIRFLNDQGVWDRRDFGARGAQRPAPDRPPGGTHVFRQPGPGKARHAAAPREKGQVTCA
nr:peptide deformylase [uncultured Tateyamaria sp.]